MQIVDINGNQRKTKKIKLDPKYPGFLKVIYSSRRDGSDLPPQWYPVETFVKNNPNLKHLTQGSTTQPKEEVGQVTSAGPDFLKDNTKNWEPDSFINYPVWISRGAGEGQTRKVITNTKNQLTIDRDWDQKPDTTSQYVLSFNLPNTKPLGNTMPGLEFQQTENV